VDDSKPVVPQLLLSGHSILGHTIPNTYTLLCHDGAIFRLHYNSRVAMSDNLLWLNSSTYREPDIIAPLTPDREVLSPSYHPTNLPTVNFGSRPSDHYFCSVCRFVCLCRVFLSRLWSDFDQSWTYVICLGLVVFPIRPYIGAVHPWGWVTPKNLYFRGLGAAVNQVA